MKQYSEEIKLNLLKSLFKGREDVFAIHWQKGSKSGYMPAYQYDPYQYRLHKIKGGTFKSYQDKSYRILTSYELQKHLSGEQLIGLYPLLEDNTSWFIVADFDNEHWASDCLELINACKDKEIPSYLERSRSGKGGHVWIFFNAPYPAVKSRKILVSMLEGIGAFSIFDKSASFDRLFPSQDFHSGKALGNLIALPLQGPSWKNGNSCFIDESLNPFADQWEFLSSIQKVDTHQLDKVYLSITAETPQPFPSAETNQGKLHIILQDSVRLKRSALTPTLINFLKDELNFTNSEYIIKKKIGKSTWGTERHFKLIEETAHGVIIPRGFIGRLLRYCNQNAIHYKFQDKRKKHPTINFTTNLNLRSHQKTAVNSTYKKEFGVIVAPPGSGKTVVGLKIIAEKQQPSLIIVHRKQLLEQWIERIQDFLSVPKNEIGRIGQSRTKSGKSVTVAMIQSLGKIVEREGKEFCTSFGTIIIDECHHIPAKSYRNIISKLAPYYQYGLTATPFRKGNDDKLIFIHLGEIIAEIKPQEVEAYKSARIVVRNTGLDIPFNLKTDPFETLSKVLVHDSSRNRLIIKDIRLELNKGNKAIIITERKEHIEALHQLLKQKFDIIKLSGDDSASARKTKWETLKKGNYQALITTGQFFGEGTDLHNASSLFLVYPFSFKGKLIQYIGRVQRSEVAPVIYDYHDQKIDYLNKLFFKRNTYYRKIHRQVSLFDEQEHSHGLNQNLLTLQKTIKVFIDQLDFRYGVVAFTYSLPDIQMELEFEIENDEIRPEFEVLKPYFSKVLKSKTIKVTIQAEIEDGMLVSQMASSDDLLRINQEIVESVKFRFIDQTIVGKHYASDSDESILNLGQVQDGNGSQLFQSEEDLLENLLKDRQVKHYRQLRYLANKHDGSRLKLRFVLNPFSFVFLITGKEQYHVILETLDTEEATYIWHFPKETRLLSQSLRLVDQDLNVIRNKGRQTFLEDHPKNFSRLVHDYSDDRKGFIIWKGRVEERIL